MTTIIEHNGRTLIKCDGCGRYFVIPKNKYVGGLQVLAHDSEPEKWFCDGCSCSDPRTAKQAFDLKGMEGNDDEDGLGGRGD